MRIITYANPFALKEKPEIWDLITRYPHYCASDTLVQGLTRYYGRTSFSIIRPLQDLINAYLGNYTDNPVNDMKLYMAVSDVIRSWPDGPMKQSFLFNKTAVVEAIQLLLPLECETKKIQQENIPEEQKKLLEIHDIIHRKDCYDAFAGLKRKTRIDFEEAIRETAAKEIIYLADQEQHRDLIQRAGINPHTRDLGEIKRAADILIEYYETHGKTNRVLEIQAAKKACELNKDPKYYQTIIIHGVHRFSPEIVYLIKNLTERFRIQIIFMIPYADGLPAVYDTWKKVYDWTHIEFENVGGLPGGNHPEANEMAQIFSGEKIPDRKKKELLKYDNLTAFAIHDVGKCYLAAKKTAGPGGNPLDQMKTQYYAVNGRECNELLKMFYPEQFKTKPFLSYPIGQLILGIYRMWDFDREEMILDPDTLIECTVSGIFQETPTVTETLRKTKLYLRGAETLTDYINRIAKIHQFITAEQKNKKLTGLKHLSFLNISLEDCAALEYFITKIDDIGKQLFLGKTKKQINYIEHFNKLMNIITEAANNDSRILPEAERGLIQSIREKLNASTNDYVEGSIEDVQDALAFFLSSRIDKNSSNWIVRDFEQIDGAVLLSHTSKAQKYHFALLSNEHMLKQNQDDLPWPLTVDLFDAYEEIRDDIQAISASIHERRSFLKFVLFYGTYFSEKELVFSFLAEEKDEQQTPYYLLSAMGFKPCDVQLQTRPSFKTPNNNKIQITQHPFPMNAEEKEIFAICPFKYLMHSVLDAEINYDNEYHITYFLRYYLTYLARDKTGKDSKHKIKAALNDIRDYLPFLGPISIGDLIRDASADLDRYNYLNASVHQRKLNFLVATWNTGEWQSSFHLQNPEKEISTYLKNDELYPPEKQLPKNSFCDYCNFQGICLRDFYMDHSVELEPETK